MICDGFNGEYSYNVSKIRVINGASSQDFYKTIYVNEPYTRFSDILMPSDANMDLYRYYYTDQDENVYEVNYESGYYINIDMDTLKDLVLTFHQEAKTMNLIINFNNNEVYNREMSIEEIFVDVFEEDGIKILKVYTLGGSGSPIYSYVLAENEECNYRIFGDGNNITVDITIVTI